MIGIEVIAAIVGSCAAVGALIWAMLGNPNVVAWLKRSNKSIQRLHRPVRREVVKVEWKEIEDAAARFVAENLTSYDLVVGIQPDGVSLANLLASKLSARFALIEKRYTQAKRTPFFVFDRDTHVRSDRESTTHFSRPANINSSASVLIVDGVTTFGNALNRAEEAVCKKLAGARIHFYVYALDRPRLAASHPGIMKRLSCYREIDNYSAWLSFPWDVR